MTYKKIEASRNARLWLTQVAAPVASLAMTAAIAFPETRKAIGNKAKSIKKSIDNKIKKGKSNDEKTIIQIDAANKQEALIALEKLAKEVFESDQDNLPVHRVVRKRI